MKIAALSLLATASSAKSVQLRGKSADSTDPNTLRVDYLFTYGAPAVAKNPHHANPGNRCIPGVRVFSEDVNWRGHITNTDFAAHINAGAGYGHPKISTLILRDVWGEDKREYIWLECVDEDNEDYYEWEWYPSQWSRAKLIDHIHSIDTVYEPRLKSLLEGRSHQLYEAAASGLALDPRILDYTSVAWCNGMPLEDTKECLKNYSTDTKDDGTLAHPNVAGVAPKGWVVDAQLTHTYDHGGSVGTDTDRVYTLINDGDPKIGRQCIISFQQSRNLADFGSFLLPYTTGFCGRTGVHVGVRNELWHIISDPQWEANIKPSLEQCDQVTCVGHSLGGALCNAFTMCANTGAEYLVGNTDPGMQNDYDMLVWTKKTRATQEQGEEVAAASE